MSAGLFWPWGPVCIGGITWDNGASAGKVIPMEKIRFYIGHAEACQTLAASALNVECKLEYVTLAGCWMDLAEERRLFLIETKRIKPH